MDTKELQQLINDTYQNAFGTTPLQQRIDDIVKEIRELARYTDLRNLREEASDALSSLIQLLNEADWEIDTLILENLAKIKKRKQQYRGLGRKYYVAILGGAFDPITSGHIQVAKFVLNASRCFDEVWLTPCYQHIYNKKMASTEDRLEMCKLAAQCDGRIKVFDYEIKNQLQGETFHFVKRLLDESFAKNQYDFSLIIGMDNANTFNKWVNYEHLEKMIRFIVVPRLGEVRDEAVDWYLKEPHVLLQHDEEQLKQISSTDIRNKFKLYYKSMSAPNNQVEIDRYGSFLTDNLDLNVFDYIITKNLYRHDLS
jgi:nicotinate-nucleotide adenylyltransferase